MDISRNSMEIVVALATAAMGAVVCYGASLNGISWGDGGPQPGYFPFYIGCLIIFGSAAIILQTVVRRAATAGEAPFIDGERLRTVVLFFLPIMAFVAISAWLGLYIGMAIYTFYAMRFSAGFRTPAALLTAVLVVAVNFIIFEKLFVVPLLKGPVLEYFGIY